MSYHSDPTAAAALGGVNREFAREEKRARRLCDLWQKGKLTDEQLARAEATFTHGRVLRNEVKKRWLTNAHRVTSGNEG